MELTSNDHDPKLTTSRPLAEQDSATLKNSLCSARFEVDSFQQAVYLKRCSNNLPCTINDFRQLYFLTLICRDNAGKGNVAFATVIISFKEIYRTGFVLSNRIYYLLATGINGIDIPRLTIKVAKFD